MDRLIAVFVALCLVTACTPRNSQNQYSASEVGVAKKVQFGTVIAVRTVNITGETGAVGTLAGGAVGGGVGSLFGKGNGRGWTTGAGILAGAIAGHAAEEAMNDRQGYEYTVTTEKGDSLVIVQEIKPEEPLLAAGARVMIQTCNGTSKRDYCGEKGTMRVLPAAALPTEIKRPKGVKVVD